MLLGSSSKRLSDLTYIVMRTDPEHSAEQAVAQWPSHLFREAILSEKSHLRLGVAAFIALHIGFNEDLQQLGQHAWIVSAIDNRGP